MKAYQLLEKSYSDLRKGTLAAIKLLLIKDKSYKLDLSIPETDGNENLINVSLENDELVFTVRNVNDDEEYEYQDDIFSLGFLIDVVRTIETKKKS